MFRRVLLAASLIAIAGCAQTAPTAVTNRFVVFFLADSAGLDPSATATVGNAASLATQRPGDIVHVLGFAAPDAGSREFNQALASARVEAVVDALRNAGVPSGRILKEARGAVPYDLMPTESRRVEIVVGR